MPVVKRLVPGDYQPEDDPRIIPYTEIEGPFGKLLQTVPAYSMGAANAQRQLLAKIEENIDFIEANFTRSKAPVSDEYWIHDAKFLDELLRFLKERNLAWRSEHSQPYGQRRWYAMHPRLGKAVMTCIGLSTAREKRFDIVTADGEFHESLLTTNEDDIFQVLLSKRKEQDRPVRADAKRLLGQLVIEISGINLKALPPEHIPELQATKAFITFQDTIRRSAMTVELDTDPEERKEQLTREAEKIVSSWRDAVDGAGKSVQKLLSGALKSGLSFASVYTAAHPSAVKLLMTGGVAIWSLKLDTQDLMEKRRQSQNFLSQVKSAQSESLLLQFPLGLT